jgi:hypothetical protein
MATIILLYSENILNFLSLFGHIKNLDFPLWVGSGVNGSS